MGAGGATWTRPQALSRRVEPRPGPRHYAAPRRSRRRGRNSWGRRFASCSPPGSLAGLLGSGCAAAAEASGCGQFKWPIAHEQAALAAPAAGPLAPGAALPADAGARLEAGPVRRSQARARRRSGRPSSRRATPALSPSTRRPRRGSTRSPCRREAGSTSSRAVSSSRPSASPRRPAAPTRARA